jgi:cytochrome c-type biogenesis protein CcmH/NrfF
LREASAIFGETWSPFCPGRTLASCTSRAASEWRQDVREWLAKGATREEVMDRLRERRPNFQFETIPNTEGMRYGPWVLGGLFLAILAALGVFHARRSAGPTGGEASPVPAAPAVDRRALDRELEALED